MECLIYSYLRACELVRRLQNNWRYFFDVAVRKTKITGRPPIIVEQETERRQVTLYPSRPAGLSMWLQEKNAYEMCPTAYIYIHTYNYYMETDQLRQLLGLKHHLRNVYIGISTCLPTSRRAGVYSGQS